MSDDLWSDYTPENWIEHLLSIGSAHDTFELEGCARELARNPASPYAQWYLETLLDESCSSDFELMAFFAIRGDERARRIGGGGGA